MACTAGRAHAAASHLGACASPLTPARTASHAPAPQNVNFSYAALGLALMSFTQRRSDYDWKSFISAVMFAVMGIVTHTVGLGAAPLPPQKS